VDIYGGCGTLGRPSKDLLDLHIDQKYFFYLAFENSLCTDYITEKFFHYYTRDVVVVVRGGADYDRLLPNDTFINASKYSSAEDLSNYLQYVAASKERYTRYLRNKDRYASNQFTSYIAFCNVCEQLHNIEANRKTYQDYRFWTKGMCRQPSDLK